jgi:hypothetical protein
MRSKKSIETSIKHEIQSTFADAEMLIETCNDKSRSDASKLNQIQSVILRLANRSIYIAELKGQLSMFE